MISVEVGISVFILLFGGALLGMHFDPFSPADQRREETRAHVQVAVGLLTSMFALLLSLQLSSGKSTFDTQEKNVTLMASKVLMLDRVLATTDLRPKKPVNRCGKVLSRC
jgi:ACR3 family arsenite efflux pump ArsB